MAKGIVPEIPGSGSYRVNPRRLNLTRLHGRCPPICIGDPVRYRTVSLIIFLFIFKVSMSKVKYRFNPKSLTYEKVRITFKERFWQFASYIATGVVFATITIMLGRQFLPSPTE